MNWRIIWRQRETSSVTQLANSGYTTFAFPGLHLLHYFQNKTPMNHGWTYTDKINGASAGKTALDFYSGAYRHPEFAT